MRLKEQRLWDAMRSNLSAAVRLERIENGVSNGTPDVMALCGGVVTFVELKAVLSMPRREATRVLGDDGLRLAQRNWHLDWHKHGGRVLSVVGVGSRSLRQHFAVWGGHSDDLNSMTQAQLRMASAACEPGAAFWPALELILKGEN